MRTLLLGSSGFIGKPLLESLANKMEITVFESNKGEHFPKNVEVLPKGSSYKEQLMQIKPKQFQRVVDCSWTGLPNLNFENNKVNLEQKLFLIEKLRQSEVTSYISFGSCLEYGSLTGEVSEGTKGKDIENFGLTKLEVLDKVESSFEHHVWFRPFYLLGSRQHKSSLLNSAIAKLSLGEQFLPRDPNSTHDFVAIDDAIESFRRIILLEQSSGIYNVGSGKLSSVNFLLNIIREHFGVPNVEDFPKTGLWANTDRLRVTTNWTNSTTITDTIHSIIDKSFDVKK